MNLRELLARRGEVIDTLRSLVEAAEGENRDLNQDEQQQYDDLKAELRSLNNRIERLQNLPESPDHDPRDHIPSDDEPERDRSRIANEARAIAGFARDSNYRDAREVDGWDSSDGEIEIQVPTGLQMRAVERRAVDSTMNVTTAADGGAAVPTGFAGAIALRRNEIRLSERLGVRMVPGRGTTVNFPYENADPSVFAATSEQADDGSTNNYERDVAPVMATKAFTLAKKTKKLWLTEELLDDEDVNLMAAIADTIGRAIGITHNSLLLTEVASNGSNIKTFASATAIAAGEIEDIVYGDTISYYYDDGGSIGFVMRPSTYGNIVSITGNDRLYAANPPDSAMGTMAKMLEGFPVHWSNQAAATAASAKDVYFGNWYFVGMREEPALRLIRDPYSVDGIVVLKYSFRTIYGVLIAGAVGYADHPSA